MYVLYRTSTVHPKLGDRRESRYSDESFRRVVGGGVREGERECKTDQTRGIVCVLTMHNE